MTVLAVLACPETKQITVTGEVLCYKMIRNFGAVSCVIAPVAATLALNPPTAAADMGGYEISLLNPGNTFQTNTIYSLCAVLPPSSGSATLVWSDSTIYYLDDAPPAFSIVDIPLFSGLDSGPRCTNWSTSTPGIHRLQIVVNSGGQYPKWDYSNTLCVPVADSNTAASAPATTTTAAPTSCAPVQSPPDAGSAVTGSANLVEGLIAAIKGVFTGSSAPGSGLS